MCPPLSQEIPLDVALDPEETVKLALTRHQAGDRQEAERLYREILEAHPRDPTALYLYGMFNAEAGRLDPAETLFAQVAEICPDKVEGHLALANLASGRGQQAEAIVSYRNVLNIQPAHATALTSLAGLYIREGSPRMRISTAPSRFVAPPSPCFPTRPRPGPFSAGFCWLTAGRLNRSRPIAPVSPWPPEKFNGLGWTSPGPAGGRRWRGRAGRRRPGRSPSAPTFPDAWAARGSALLALYRAPEAVTAFERGIALAPDQARMHLGLGDALAELDRNIEAVEHLARAATLDPASKWANANLGSVLYRCGALDNAEHYCKLALAIDPALAVAHRNLAGVYTDQGKLNLAQFHCDAAFTLNNVLVKGAANAKASVLVLTTSDNGNIPYKHLLPLGLYTRIEWFIEYAKDVQTAKLPPYDVVFNIIGDPDYAARTDAPVAAFLQACERPWLNDPAKMALTRRDRLPSLLGDIEDVVVPAAARLEASDGRSAISPPGWPRSA